MRDRNLIPVGVSNRHCHLSKADIATLFGSGYRLQPLRWLSQQGQYAAQESLMLIGPKGEIENLRILGPSRVQTQVELAGTDARKVGIRAPVRYSGDLQDSAAAKLIGPAGEVHLDEGVIQPLRHIHFSPQEAASFGVWDRARVMVRAAVRSGINRENESRQLIFDNVLARVHPKFSLDFHIDTDEGNAAGLRTGDYVTLAGFSDLNAGQVQHGLITENDVRKAIRKNARIIIDEKSRLTPAAKDLGREWQIFDER